MKQMLRLVYLFLLCVLIGSSAQSQWQCLYVTLDGSANGTGDRTTGVGVIKDNMFVALCTRPSFLGSNYSYMIPYVGADSVLGRKYDYGYGTSGVFQVWTDGGFDQVTMNDAWTIRARPDSTIYVASNDNDHNILVFKYSSDTVTVVSPFPRQQTGANSIYGLDVDNSGYVYVCNDTSIGVSTDLKIYAPIAQWTPSGHTDPPLKTVDLPDGIYKGIAVKPDGSAIFIADYTNKRVVKYTGSRTTGYTLAAGFSFSMGPADTITGTPPMRTGPIGLAYLSSKNILAVACDSLMKPAGSTWYAYGRIYLLNGNTGALISADPGTYLIDQAAWSFQVYGSYANQGAGNCSGYASTMDVKWDANENLYSQSVYGWTVEKWKYNGTLPNFSTGVEETGDALPGEYMLSQNYPNPFNPSTKIDFSIKNSGFVTLKVYDVLGQEVKTLVNEQKDPGTYRVTFEARDLTSGAYFYTLTAGNFTQTYKMLLVK